MKNALQVTLNKPEDIANLETYLFQIIQEEPENIAYTELLIWANLQTKNFNSAYIQARALDRRLTQGGQSLMEIGKMALSNGDYKAADKIFGYIATTYFNNDLGIQAELWKMTTREEEIKNTYPVNSDTITQESRTTHPAWMYKDLEQDHRQYLHLDPQENAIIGFQNNLNTRVLEIDNYKPSIPSLILQE